MTKASAHIAQIEKYTSEGSIIAIESLTDDQFDALNEALEEFNGAGDLGIDVDCAKTSETLADFDEARMTRWNERGSRKEHTFCGFAAVQYSGFQLFRGKPRQSMIVVDLGSHRVALT